MSWGWVALAFSLALTGGGMAAESFLGARWGGALHYVGLSAFVGCFTNKLAIAALFDPWPWRGFALPGTGVIGRRAEEIASEVARAVGERILTPELFRARSAEALESAMDSGILDSEDVYFSVRKVIEDAGGTAGKVGHLTGLADYDVLTHRVIDSVRERVRELSRPGNALSELIEKGAVALDVERIVRERLEEFGPGGLRDLAHDLSRKHLVWLEVWGAVFGAAAGIVAWMIAAR